MTTTDHASDVDGRDLGPVFGEEEEQDARVPFQLAVYDSRERKTLHPLTARSGIDASSVFGFMSPKVSLPKRIGAMKNFLLRSLVDDDGISVHELPRAVVKDTGGDDSEWRAVAELDYTPRGSDVRFIVGDNTDWPDEEAALEHARAHGSSLRRFTELMDDDTLRIKQSALEGIIGHIVGEGGDRPTKPSKASSGSRKTTARSGRS